MSASDAEIEAATTAERLAGFLNAAKILRSIDRHELAAAGIQMDWPVWTFFREFPAEWLIRASDDDQAKVWSIVEARMDNVTSEKTPCRR